MSKDAVCRSRLPILPFVLLCAFQAYGQAPLPVIAVIPFKAVNAAKSDAEIVAGLFETALVKTGVFRVIEQVQVHEILKVQEFLLSDCVSDTCAIEVGQLLSAEQMVLGSLALLSGKFILNAKIVDVAKGISIKADKVETFSLAEMIRGAEVLAYKLAGLTYRQETEEGIAQEFGSVFVETDPPGAAIVMNGINRGSSPLLIGRIPLGFVRIECHKGELQAMEDIRVARGVSKVFLTLTQQFGSLFIRSSNYAVEAILDGQKLGMLDSGLYERIPVGRHILELTGTGLYWAAEVMIQLGEITQIEATPRAAGSISYRLPKGTRAEIRGEGFLQTVEGEGTLTPVWEGIYAVQITGDVYEPYSQEVHVERAKDVTVNPFLFYNRESERQKFIQLLEDADERLSGASGISPADLDELERIQAELQSAHHQHADLLVRSEALLSKYEHQRLSQLVDGLAQRFSRAFKISLKDFDRLAAAKKEIGSAHREHRDLLDKIASLAPQLEKQARRQEAGDPLKLRIEPTEMQLPSQNPAYLGVLSYAQLSVVGSVGGADWYDGERAYLRQYDFDYRDLKLGAELGFSMPLGARLGLQASAFLSGLGPESLEGGTGDWEQITVLGPDLGGQISLGVALSDAIALGAAVSVFYEESQFGTPNNDPNPPDGRETRSAYSIGALVRNAASTMTLDLLVGVSLGRRYLLQAEDYRDYLDFAVPFALGDSVASPIRVEGAMTFVLLDRHVYIMISQSNRIFTDQEAYTGRITPSAELWLFPYFAVHGALDLSVHKTKSALVHGGGASLGISFKSLRGAWCLDLGCGARTEPIRSLPGVVVFQPPTFYASFIKNLLAIPRRR